MRAKKGPFFWLMRWLLDSTKGQALVARRTNHVIRGLELLLPLPWPPRRTDSWRLNQSPMANDLINHTYIMKPSLNPKRQVWRASRLNHNSSTCHLASPQTLRGQKCLCLGLCPVYLFIWLLIRVFNILRNKSVIWWAKGFPKFSEPL